MAKLRHVAVVVRDLETATRFYERIFDMKRAHEVKNTAIYLTDGVMNLALLNYDVVNRPGSKTADGRVGIHHLGFRVADMKATQAEIEANGGQYAFDLGDPNGMNFERKFLDPEGMIFDISEKGWYGALDEAIAQAKEPAAV
ncbi:MAG TPA: VOC family protein [Stellaceae bacterium]|nr:VOC family protein [Stellaceae bacterium]